jgi:phage terminase large subunit GpA-like protein
MKSDPIQRLRNAFAASLLPPPAVLVSEWARKNFRLSSEYSAAIGNFEPYPYQVEPLDFLSPSNPADTGVLMVAAQMMKTLTMLIFLGYVIDRDPGPVLIVQPSKADADAFSKERIDPMLRDLACIEHKIVQAKSRHSGNTIDQKRFRGGSVSLTGTVSARGLRRRSVRFLLLDEVDGYEDTRDGDPIVLAAARTSKFWNRKILLCSTPTIEGRSRIARAFEDSDQRRYFVPCPFCKYEQTLIWRGTNCGVRWGQIGDRYIPPEDAHYECEGCQELIPHYRKIEMLRAGRYVATNPNGKYPGWWISRLYATDWSWGRIVTDPLEGFFATKDDPVKFKAFVNNVLAETWKETGEAPDHEKLMVRRDMESYRLGEVPAGVVFLTAGVDVQKTWIEGYVWGWGRSKQRWIIDHFRIEKNPYDPMAWDDLSLILNRTYQHQSGAEIAILRMAIDSGHATNEVYAWARQHSSSRVLAIDGRPRGAALIGMPSQVDVTVLGRKIKHGCKLWPVNVSMAKSELYGFLGQERPVAGEPFPVGWVHFPRDLEEEVFKQLTAEQLVTRLVKGYRKTEWVKDPARRNEALDCAGYARAAAAHVGLDRFSERRWTDLETALKYADTQKPEPESGPVQVAQSQPQSGATPHRKPSWFGDRGRDWFSR